MKLERAGRGSNSTPPSESSARSTSRPVSRSYVGQRASAEADAELLGPSLDVLGRMASEVSHELNNQLAAALNYAAILERRVGPENPLTEHLIELRGSLWRATNAAAALRLIGRRGGDQPEVLAIDEAVDVLAPVLRHLTPACKLEVVENHAAMHVRARRADLERLIVAITLYAYSRRCEPHGLRLTWERIEPGQRGGSWVRIVCELDDEEGSLDRAQLVRGRVVARSGLRRALKRCRARIGHDPTRTWVELPLAVS